MEPTLGLLGGGGGGGGGGGRGGTEGSSYENEAEIELGLGLGLSGGVKGKGYFRKIMTAKDLPGGFAGTKRAADFGGSPPDDVGIGGYSASGGGGGGASSQVVGWPPIKAYRMNSLVNQAKGASDEEDKRVGGNDKSNDSKKKINHGTNNKNDSTVKERGHLGFVKVNMDGLPIGRKVDLNAHICYETLAQTLEDMFLRSPTTINSSRSNGEKQQATQRSKLLDGSSDFVLTYEDKEGDWMLVGDVPWGMFLSTVKRLRIMKTSEANGLAPRFQGGNERQKVKHI